MKIGTTASETSWTTSLFAITKGKTARAEAATNGKQPSQPNVVRIPTSALLFREGGLKVAMVGPNNKAVIKPVRPGRDLGTEMEILGGLTPSDRVIDSPPDSLIAGEKVRLAGSLIDTAEAQRIAVARK